jgi:hypothetical protein
MKIEPNTVSKILIIKNLSHHEREILVIDRSFTRKFEINIFVITKIFFLRKKQFCVPENWIFFGGYIILDLCIRVLKRKNERRR